jgi:hypothetical protein
MIALIKKQTTIQVQLMIIKIEIELDTNNQADCDKMQELIRIFEEYDRGYDDER